MRRKEVPFPGVPLILNFGPPFRLLDPNDPTRSGQLRSSFVAGIHQQFALTESPGYSYCLQVNLTPLGAYSVLGLPMHQIADQVVGLEDLLGATGNGLIERLADAPDWETRFDLIDGFLLESAQRGRRPSTQVSWAWRQLCQSDGRVSIGELGKELRVSRRHLVAQFREQIGLSPKLVGRIMRFNRVVSLLKLDDGARWSRIAHECGYHDQSHLNHDFRQFAGATPSEYLGRILPGGGGVAAD
jgi:AraC-like DNA-binding protein